MKKGCVRQMVRCMRCQSRIPIIPEKVICRPLPPRMAMSPILIYNGSIDQNLHESGESVVTIKDIAQMAGVSFTTVSKALNGEPGVRAETRDKIISEHGVRAY